MSTIFSQANAAFQQGRSTQAIQLYQQAIDAQPTIYFYYENLALALEQMGRLQDALKAYEMALQLQPTAVGATLGVQRLAAIKNVNTNQVPQVQKPWADPKCVALMRSTPVRNPANLKAEYMAKGLHKQPDSFALYRVIGNDLYPRHAKGQSRQNVAFILQHEADFPNCTKYWILNRIVDAEERAALIHLLERYKQNYIEIPFQLDEFKVIPWDFSLFKDPSFMSSKDFIRMEAERQERAILAIYAAKNRYLMNNNGARNTALKRGKQQAKWVLPWDGNCFITPQAWAEIKQAVKTAPYLKYFVVPMERLLNNQDVLKASFSPQPTEEPQLIFRADTTEQFNPAYPYGRRPKVELFWRLGIPGKWSTWEDDAWDQPRKKISVDYQQFGVAGWVGRLFSGNKEQETSSATGFQSRGFARQTAILSSINYVTYTQLGQQDSLGLSLYAQPALDRLKAAYKATHDSIEKSQAQFIIQQANEALKRQPGSVVDKTECAPSGDPHDYYHPAPYWWPDPESKDGLPYVWRDGVRVPGTIMYSAESSRYDRTRLQYLFDDGISLALAWYLTADAAYAQHAVAGLRRWFIDPKTRMNPHLKYAQVRQGHHGNQGKGSGIIEMKDLYYYLDAIRLLATSNELTAEDQQGFNDWLLAYSDWLITSSQGKNECAAANNHGTYYDLQVAAIAAYLADYEGVFKVLLRARSRLGVQLLPDGQQPAELARTQTAHYCCFNLQAWLHLAVLARRYGDPLLSHTEQDVALLPAAFGWLAEYFDQEWPYPQIEPFDRQRFVALAHLAQQLGMSLNTSKRFQQQMSETYAHTLRFYPHDGIAPYWALIE